MVPRFLQAAPFPLLIPAICCFSVSMFRAMFRATLTLIATRAAVLVGSASMVIRSSRQHCGHLLPAYVPSRYSIPTKYGLAGCSDATLHVWELEHYRRLRVIATGAPVLSLAYSKGQVPNRVGPGVRAMARDRVNGRVGVGVIYRVQVWVILG